MMSNLIIVEGTDCAGKTTFIQEVLVPKTGAEVVKHSKPNVDPSLYFSPVIDRARAGEKIICDRHLIGERVYAKVKKTPSEWREGEYERMLGDLNELHATLILIWEYKPTLEHRFDTRGETFVNKKEMWQAQNLFKKEFKRLAKLYPNITFLTWKQTTNTIRLLK